METAFGREFAPKVLEDTGTRKLKYNHSRVIRDDDKSSNFEDQPLDQSSCTYRT